MSPSGFRKDGATSHPALKLPLLEKYSVLPTQLYCDPTQAHRPRDVAGQSKSRYVLLNG